MKLKQLVAQHERTFPWYTKFLQQNKGDFDHLDTLPLMTEEILTQHYYHDDRALPEPAYSYLTSGTTSGKRKRIFYSDRDQRLYLQQRTDIIRRFCGVGCIRACADLGTGHAASTVGQIFEAMGCKVELIDFTLPIERHIEVLNRFKPEIFFTMPMILDRLIASSRLDFHPKRILLLGDVASPLWQKRVQEHFSVAPEQILDLFGSIEIGSIAFYNHDENHYEFDSYLIPEVVPPEQIHPHCTYKGRGGILLLTSFARDYFPAVRFVTNDLVEGFSSVTRSGKTIYTFERCLGRFATEFKHGEKINLSDISDAMAKHLPYHRYDLDDHGGTLRIRIGAQSVPDEAVAAITNELLRRNPDVAKMITSGLVGDIQIHCVDSRQITDHVSKRRY